MKPVRIVDLQRERIVELKAEVADLKEGKEREFKISGLLNKHWKEALDEVDRLRVVQEVHTRRIGELMDELDRLKQREAEARELLNEWVKRHPGYNVAAESRTWLQGVE